MALSETNDGLVHGRRTRADAEADTPGLMSDEETPRASERTSPVVRAILAALGVGMGFAAICWGIGSLFFTTAADDANDSTAAAFTLAGGVCFLLAGVMIWRDSLLWTAILAVGGLIFGVLSTDIM